MCHSVAHHAEYHNQAMPDFMREHGSVLNMVSMKRLVDAGVHYGHHKRYAM